MNKVKDIKNINKNGFTLVETMIYVAIISVVVGSFINFGLSISDIRSKSEVIQKVQSGLQFSLDLMSKKIRKAEGVIEPLSGESGNILILDMPGSEVDVTFELLNGIVYITEGASDSIQLVENSINITNLLFVNTSENNNKDNIRIILEGKYRYDESRAFSYSESLQTAVSVRR